MPGGIVPAPETCTASPTAIKEGDAAIVVSPEFRVMTVEYAEKIAMMPDNSEGKSEGTEISTPPLVNDSVNELLPILVRM